MTVPAMPAAVARLPRQPGTGYPVPWFVGIVDGRPDFRVADGAKLKRAVSEGRCWICGGRLLPTTLAAFVIGPMCAVNRVSSEPPSHPSCATYSARACPFLTTPGRVRRPHNMPEASAPPAGTGLAHNPGVALVWSTVNWEPRPVWNGTLFHIGDPIRVEWWCQGRAATRAEVLDAIDKGLPLITAVADEDGPEARQALAEAVAYVRRTLLPA